MKRKTIKIIAIVLTAVILFGSVVTVVLMSNKNHDVLDVNSETQAEEKTTTPTEQPDESETTVKVPEEELLPSTHVHLKEGNETYYDELVLVELETLERLGKEDEVNLALDWLALIINHYVEEGYCPKTIRQIQRFYFVTMDRIMTEDFDAVREKITLCFPQFGTEKETLRKSVESVFGWTDVNYSYIYEMGE